MSPIEAISLGVAVVSFAYALYQGTQNRRIKNFARSESWNLYSRASNTNGQYQKAIQLYKERYGDNLDPDVIENLGMGNAHGQNLTRDTIRMIQLSEPRFDLERIGQWVSSNKIFEGHRKLFEVVASDEKARRWNPLRWGRTRHLPKRSNDGHVG